MNNLEKHNHTYYGSATKVASAHVSTEQIVARQAELRTSIDAIVADLEGKSV